MRFNTRFLMQRWRARKPLKLLVVASANLQGIFGTVSGAEIHPPHVAADHARNWDEFMDSLMWTFDSDAPAQHGSALCCVLG